MIYLNIMYLELLFALYFVALILSVIYLGFNYVRIKESLYVHPKIIAFLLPFLINVHLN